MFQDYLKEYMREEFADTLDLEVWAQAFNQVI